MSLSAPGFNGDRPTETEEARLFFYNGIREFFNSRIFRIAGSGESLIESFPGKTIKFHTFLSLLLSVFQNAFGSRVLFLLFHVFLSDSAKCSG